MGVGSALRAQLVTHPGSGDRQRRRWGGFGAVFPGALGSPPHQYAGCPAQMSLAVSLTVRLVLAIGSQARQVGSRVVLGSAGGRDEEGLADGLLAGH